MRRNGFRVIQKELKTFYDGTRKANLDVEIAVDMLSLAGPLFDITLRRVPLKVDA
jgi:uncharacterized LabA/DUF88 family protein